MTTNRTTPRHQRLLGAVITSSCLIAAACGSPAGNNDDDAGTDASTDIAADVNVSDTSDVASDALSDWVDADSERCDNVRQALETSFEEAGVTGAAMTVAWADELTMCSGTAGLSQVETTETWAEGRLFRIGSVTKTFTASMVFQLIDEGVVSLDDRLDDWVPGYYDDVGVTVRHLMSNTSGIVSYNYVGSFNDGAQWEPTELVDWAVTHEPDLRFEPGAEWEYSNTNFVLLGLIVEAAGGVPYQEALQTRLLDPLGLNDTYLALSGDSNPAIVDSYDADGTNLTDASDPSFGWAAGAMVSSPTDLARWAVALYGGDVISDESLTLMTTVTLLNDGTPAPDYGLGSFAERDEGLALFGHTGGIAGYLTYMYYFENEDVALVAMVNQKNINFRDFTGLAWMEAVDL